jgi:hypothetical protein
MQSYLHIAACLLLLAASSGTLLLGLKLLLDARKFRTNSVVVQGRYAGDKIEDSSIGADALSSRLYRNKVAFDCPFTLRQRVVVAFVGSNAQSLRWVGERMSVLVNVAPPHDVRVNSFRHLYLLPVAMIVFGAPLSWIIVVIMVAR